jgi:hypothetical protein
MGGMNAAIPSTLIPMVDPRPIRSYADLDQPTDKPFLQNFGSISTSVTEIAVSLYGKPKATSKWQKKPKVQNTEAEAKPQGNGDHVATTDADSVAAMENLCNTIG